MKNRSGTYGDTKKTLPLEGGGKSLPAAGRGGGKRPDGHSKGT